MQFSTRQTSLLRKSTKLFTKEFHPLKRLLTFFRFKTYTRLPFRSIIYLWMSSVYFQSIHKWKNRCSLFNRQFTAKSREYQWPYTIKLYCFFFSPKQEKLETCHWHIELYELRLLPTEIWRARISVGIIWHDSIKYKWSCAHLYQQQIWEYIHMASTFIMESLQNQ